MRLTKYYGYEEKSVGEVRGFHLFLTVKVCECGLSIIREKVCAFCVHVVYFFGNKFHDI